MITRPSKRKPMGKFLSRKDAKNIPYFWLTTERYSSIIHKKDSDIWAVENNYISISPLNIAILSAASKPSTSAAGSDSAYPRCWASFKTSE